RLSPGLMVSPGALNHLVILPSATVSPSCGIKISMRASSPSHRDVLGFQKLHQALVRALAANAALLHAAEGCGRIGYEAAVKANHAEIEPLRDPHAAAKVTRVHIGDESVLGVVCTPDDFVLGAEALQRRDGPKDFLAQQACGVRHLVEHGRRIEITRP